jgi:hypothetical protein
VYIINVVDVVFFFTLFFFIEKNRTKLLYDEKLDDDKKSIPNADHRAQGLSCCLVLCRPERTTPYARHDVVWTNDVIFCCGIISILLGSDMHGKIEIPPTTMLLFFYY